MNLRLVSELARSSDPDTSWEAAHFNLPGKESQAYALLRGYAAQTVGLFWRIGLTAREAEHQFDIPKAHKRVSELHHLGFLEEVLDEHGDVVKRAFLSSSRSRALRITQKGKDYLKENDG